MEKKYRIIYIWSFLIISGIVLLLLYTPLGGDLHYAAYSEQNRYAVAPGVNYQSQVGSLSSGGSSAGYSSPLPSAYMSESYKNGTLANASYTTSSGFNTTSNSYSAGSGISMRNSKSAKNEQTGSGSAFTLGGVGKKSGSEISNQSSVGGGLGGSLNSTTTSTGGVMQRGAADEGDPLDPGGDPTGDPLPLNGEWFMILLAIGYTALKILKKQH
jgi:hypothetical protein